MKTTIDSGRLACILIVGITSIVFGNLKAAICLSGAAAAIYTVVDSEAVRKRLQ